MALTTTVNLGINIGKTALFLDPVIASYNLGTLTQIGAPPWHSAQVKSSLYFIDIKYVIKGF